MKKNNVLVSVLTAIVLLSSNAAAVQPSGLKDVDGQTQAEEANIDVLLETKFGGLIVNNDIAYHVSLKAGNSEACNFTITASCGSVSDTQNVSIKANSSYNADYVLEDCPKGENILTISIKCNGKEVTNYTKSLTIVPTVPRYFLDEVTSKLGYNTPYDYNGYRESMTTNGVRAMRTEFSQWRSVESKKGKYSFTHLDGYMKAVQDMDIEVVGMLGYNNPLYMDSGTGNGPDSKGNIDGYAQYAKNMAMHFPDLENIELWNEPNIFFWYNPNARDYGYTAEVAYNEIKRVNPDVDVMICSVASGDAKFMHDAMEDGLWANCDTISYHPYVRPSTVDEAMDVVIQQCQGSIMANGGWKVPICSEIGWPSNGTGMGITKEQQAHEYAKVFLVEQSYGVPITIIHNTFDTAWEGSSIDPESFYGIVYPDFSPKPSYYTTAEANNQTNGAVYIGNAYFDNKDIRMLLFARDNQIHAALWSKGDEADVKLNGSGLTCYDEIGNPIEVSGNTVTAVEAITYVHGLDMSYAYSYLADNFADILSQNIGHFEDCEELKGFAEAKSILYSAVDDAKNIKSMPLADEALALLNSHYEKSTQIIDMYKNGDLQIPFKRLTALLSLHHMLGEKYINLYMLASGEKTENIDADAAIDEARKIIDEKKRENTLSGASAILKYACNDNEKADKVIGKSGSNPMKNGYINSRKRSAVILADMASKVAEAENVGHDNILLQLPSSQKWIDLGTEEEPLFSLYNYRTSEMLKGHVEVYSPNGILVGKSDKVELAAGSSMQVPVKVKVDELSDGNFIMKFIENDEVIVERIAPIEVKNQIEVSFAPIMKTVEEVDTVTVRLENVYGKELNGKISVTPRCDWNISNSTQEFKLEKGEKKDISFGVSKKTKEPYNFYVFDILITNENGEVIYKKYLPLDFTIITKSTKSVAPEEFTGDISDWSDAYPIYCDTPENPEDYSQWQEEDVGARMMMKWDEKYYYILCDVYDQFQINSQAGANIWNGDSLQLDWDTLNDDSVNLFKPDDYEYGFALTQQGPRVYSWQRGAAASGEMPTSWLNVYDNRKERLTRYYMRIPAEDLSPLNFAEGQVFGFNFLVNDADFTNREKDIEYTWGISVVKDPSSYEDFKFVGVQEAAKGDVKIPIPVSLDEIKNSGTELNTNFEDIKGHWAESQIKTLANVGILSGVSSIEYQPERRITRAEFVCALIRAAGKDAVYENEVYSDITSDKWYSPYIAAAKKLGWIPEQMAFIRFYPDNIITRQEAAYLINCWRQSEGKTADYRFMGNASDVNTIDDWAVESVQNLYNAEIMVGDEQNKINPLGGMTRAEAARLLATALEK